MGGNYDFSGGKFSICLLSIDSILLSDYKILADKFITTKIKEYNQLYK